MFRRWWERFTLWLLADVDRAGIGGAESSTDATRDGGHHHDWGGGHDGGHDAGAGSGDAG